MTKVQFIDAWEAAPDKIKVMVETILKIERFWQSGRKEMTLTIKKDISVEEVEDAQSKTKQSRSRDTAFQ